MTEEITNWFKKITYILENLKYPSLGPHLRLLKLTGLWHPNKFQRVFSYVVIAFYFSLYVKCLINHNRDSLQLFLHYAPFHVGVVKTCHFLNRHRSWEKLINFMSSLERNQLSKLDTELKQITEKYIRQNRRVTYLYWAMAVFNVIPIFTEPYQKNQVIENGTSIYVMMFDGYTPFSREPPGYYASMMVQTVFGIKIYFTVVSWDSLIVALMIAFSGQLKIAHFFCKQIIDKNNNNKSHQNIVKFHRYYINLIRYQELFDSMMSPVMFINLIIVSVNLGFMIIQLVELQDDIRVFLVSFSYVVGCLVQLLLFYWYSNEVMTESLDVSYGVFESDWLEADKRSRKEIALLSVTTTKRLVFRAGPFSEMTLSSFVLILRSSYSYYTILNKTS